MPDPDQDPSATSHKKTEGGLSGISGAIRPLVKELVKVGLVAYETVSESASGIGKQFNDLLEEARSESVKPPSNDPTAEHETKGDGTRKGKVKDAPRKSSSGSPG